MRFLLKLLCTVPASILSRKFGRLRHLLLFLLVVFIFYVTTTLYSVSNEKISSLELFNETVNYMETPISVNTETANVEIRKQHAIHTYERPHLLNETVSVMHSIQIGEVVPNCGLPKNCNNNEFVVHLYSGRDHSDEPRLCIDGKYVLSKDINDGGRGMNVAVVDNMTRMITRVAHFDTYEKDSIIFETLLLTLRPGDIVIILTFDEPSRKLSRIAKLLLYDLGSGLIQNLGYRGSWYLVTQKGISGFSPFEDIHLVESNGWPRHHDIRFCVPFEIKGLSVHPDPLPSNNQFRVEFCEKYDDLPLFCDADVVNDPLIPAPVWKQPSAINKIYNVPIVIMSGENAQFLPLTLETLIHQPGIKPSMVVVCHLPKYSMVQKLTELFGFISEELSQTANYCERMAEAFEIANVLYPDAGELIFIGENTILAPDFLFYFGQLLSILKSDSSLSSVSALNENGFKYMSGDPTLTYRVESVFNVATLVKKEFFLKSLCHNKSDGDSTHVPFNIRNTSVVPDVSRVTLAYPIGNSTASGSISSVLLSNDRTVTYEQNILLKSPEMLFEEDYDREFKSHVSSAVPLKFNNEFLKLCMNKNKAFQMKLLAHIPGIVNNSTNISIKLFTIYFYQNETGDISTLQYLSQCIGLFHHPLYPVRGLYKGTVRFMLKDHQAVLIGTKSPFYAFKSNRTSVVKFDNVCNCLISIIM